MPIILLNKAERLPLKFPEPLPPISEAQSLWSVVQAELRATKTKWTEALERLDAALMIPLQPTPDDEATTIYYHRLLPDERKTLENIHTERGEVKFDDLWLAVAQAAVDAWEGLYDADLKPVSVPHASSEDERRKKIAELVYHFPPGVRQTIANAALADSADELKNAWRSIYGGGSSSPTSAQDASSPVATAAATTPRNTGALPAIMEG